MQIRQMAHIYTTEIQADPTWVIVYDRIRVYRKSGDVEITKCEIDRPGLAIGIYQHNKPPAPTPAPRSDYYSAGGGGDDNGGSPIPAPTFGAINYESLCGDKPSRPNYYVYSYVEDGKVFSSDRFNMPHTVVGYWIGTVFHAGTAVGSQESVQTCIAQEYSDGRTIYIASPSSTSYQYKSLLPKGGRMRGNFTNGLMVMMTVVVGAAMITGTAFGLGVSVGLGLDWLVR